MKYVLSLSLAVAAFVASAGTREPTTPAPAVSEAACALDTTVSGLGVAAAVSPLDTLLDDWDWSPWPGIFLNTKPFRAFFFVIR